MCNGEILESSSLQLLEYSWCAFPRLTVLYDEFVVEGLSFFCLHVQEQIFGIWHLQSYPRVQLNAPVNNFFASAWSWVSCAGLDSMV